MDKKDTIKKAILQLRERMLNLKKIDSPIVEYYISLEKQFKKTYPQVSFEKYSPITHLSWFERFGNVEFSYERRFNPILNRLEYMISNFPDEILEKELTFFWKMIDDNITIVSKNLFDGGHYSDSVFKAFKEVNNKVKRIVKNKEGKELDGKNLMLTAFSVNKPIIHLDDISNQSGKDIQEGFMHIFAGSMQGIRNPKAHENIEIDKKMAMSYISLANLLMNKLDVATY